MDSNGKHFNAINNPQNRRGELRVKRDMVYTLSGDMVCKKCFMPRKVLDMRRNVLGYLPMG